MTLFGRIRRLWIGFWNGRLEKAEQENPEMMNQGIIDEHQNQLGRLRRALTELIFQRNRLQHQLGELVSRESQLRQDIELAAKSDRDELALELIAQLEKVTQEIHLLGQNLEQIISDIAEAKQTELNLSRETGMLKTRLASLGSRHQFLQMRQELKVNVERAALVQGSGSSGANRIQERIFKLEADIESMGESSSKWDKEISDLRAQKSKERHWELLMRIKNKSSSIEHQQRSNRSVRALVPVS